MLTYTLCCHQFKRNKQKVHN